MRKTVPATRLDATRRRAQILNTAMPVFARFGFAGTSTRQIAAAASIAEPILYRHFRNKAALFRAVLDLVARRLEHAIGAVIASAAGARARLLALAAALPGLLAAHEDELRVLCGAAASHTDTAQTRATRAALTRLGTVLTKGLGGPGLRRGVDRATAAYFLLEVGLGSALLRPVGVRAVSRRGYGERALALLTHALLP
ncbi:MAG TPA: helix-turn-helix domain-containing protein [Planctomycetota bacterium]|nr:helix-turn-helix domain-containing protein [Planctomycetota bacterium]